MFKHRCRAAIYLALPSLLALAACHAGDAEPLAEAPAATASRDAETDVDRLAVHPWLPTPVVSAQVVAAKDTLSVRCPAEHLAAGTPQTSLVPSIVPAMSAVKTSSLGHVYMAERPGLYQVRCFTADGRAGGPLLQVEVVAGEPVTVAVVLQKTDVVAGEKVVAQCTGFDAAGNAVTPPGADARLKGTTVVAAQAYAQGGKLTAATFTSSQPLWMRAQDGRTLQLSGEQAGETSLGCSVPAWPSLPASQPVTLRVHPAPAQTLTATVADGPHAAMAPVLVQCTAHDAYGNLAAEPALQVQVTGAGETQLHSGGFVPRKMGAYSLVCMPGPGSQAQPSAPISIDVQAGRPARWEVKRYRQGRCETVNRALPLTWNAFDAAGNWIKDLQVELETTPQARVRRARSGGFVFEEEGTFDIVLKAVGEGAEALAPWSGHFIIDSTPPSIEIFSPARGEQLASGEETQLITGRVVDAASAVTSLTINGETVELVPDKNSHRFSVPHKSHWGLNIIRATTMDACGNFKSHSQSYLRSASFGPLVDEPLAHARVPHGVRAAAAQPLWDDGDPTGGHDISFLLEQALRGGGLDERLPTNLAAVTLWGALWTGSKSALDVVENRCLGWSTKRKENGVEVVRTDPLTMSEPRVEFLHVEEGGIHLAVTFDSLRLPLAITTYAGMPCSVGTQQSLNATLAAQKLRIEVRAKVGMEHGHVRVEVCPTCVQADFVGSPPNFLFEGGNAPNRLDMGLTAKVTNLLLHHSSGLLKTALEARVRQDVTREGERLLGGLRLNHSIPMVEPLQGFMAISSGVDAIALRGGPTGGGTSEVSLYTQVYAPLTLADPNLQMPVPLAPMRGPIRHDKVQLLPLNLPSSDQFALSVHDDFLNQVMWSLWASGSFNGLTSDSFRSLSTNRAAAGADAGKKRVAGNLLDGAHVTVHFMSPPVVMPTDDPSEVILAVGDVYVQCAGDFKELFSGVPETDPNNHLRLRFFTSLRHRVRLTIDDARHTLHAEPIGAPDIDLDLVSIDRGALMADTTVKMHKFLAESMMHVLTQPLVNFPLPLLQIGMLPGIPDDAAWRLEGAELVRPAGAQEILLRGRFADLPRTLDDADPQEPHVRSE